MNRSVSELMSSNNLTRHWPARIDLTLAQKAGRTRLLRNCHMGPLRVQRPFYPEGDCCHLYLLHPPGGLVIGDDLQINVALEVGAQGLLTTPSAGKVYGAKGAKEQQQQCVTFSVAENACVEWLPQETIVFNSARAQLHTRITLEEGALFAGWDIIRLGRAASGETFAQGECRQTLEIYRQQRPLFIERNHIVAGSPMQRAVWGLKGCNTLGTLMMTVNASREQVDALRMSLNGITTAAQDLWGVTQKENLLLVRYLGNDVALCRAGFEWVWQEMRCSFNQRVAAIPRIWAT